MIGLVYHDGEEDFGKVTTTTKFKQKNITNLIQVKQSDWFDNLKNRPLINGIV